MTSPFAQAASALMAANDAAAGVEILYKRPSTNQEICIRATPGKTDHEEFDDNGMPVAVRSKDWMFPAALLKLNGVDIVEPAEADEIRWSDEQDTTHVFRVMRFGRSGQVFRYSDVAQLRLRVHTKRTGSE